MSHPDQNPHGALYQAFEALQRVARMLSAQDVAETEVQLTDQPVYRPITEMVGAAAQALQDYIAEEVGLVTGQHVGLQQTVAEVTPLRS